MLTKDECLFALKEEMITYEEIPGEYLDEDFYHRLVSVDGMYLEYIDVEKRTEKLCEEAVLNNYNALNFVPELYKTKDFYLRIIKDRYDIFEQNLIPMSILYSIKIELIKKAYQESNIIESNDRYTSINEFKNNLKKLSKVLIKIKNN